MTDVDERAASQDAARPTGHDELGPVSPERLTFFSDAVVAIAMTLLALELPVPVGRTNAEALRFLGDHIPEYYSFLISFAVIGIHWAGHHRIFRWVRALGGRVARWNMLWLLMSVLTPFATKTLAGSGAFQVRFITYAAVQALAGLFFLLMLYELDRNRLFREEMPRPVLTSAYARLAGMATVFAVSIPVSLVAGGWAYLCWIAMPAVMRGTMWLAVRRRARGRP